MPRYARRRTQASGRWYRAEEESDRILERLTPFQKMTLSGAYFANLFADMYGAKFGFSTPNQRREKNLTLSFQFLWSCWAAWICLKSFWSDFSVAFSLFSGWVFYLHTIYLWASYCGHFKPEFQYWLHFWFGSMIHGSSFLSVLGTHLDGSSLETLFDTWPTLASVLSDDLYGSPLLRYAVTFGPCVVTQMLFWTETEYWAVNLYEFFFHEPTANRHTLLVYQVIAPFLPFAVWHRLFNPRDDLLTDIPFGIGPGTILGVLLLLYVEFTYVDAVGQSWKSWPMFVEGGRGWMIQYKDDDEYEPPYGIKPVPMALYGGPEGVQFGQEEEPRMRELFEEEPPKEEDAAGGKSDTTPSRRPTAPTRLKPVGNPKKQKRYRAKEQSDYQTKLPFGEFIWH